MRDFDWGIAIAYWAGMVVGCLLTLMFIYL